MNRGAIASYVAREPSTHSSAGSFGIPALESKLHEGVRPKAQSARIAKRSVRAEPRNGTFMGWALSSRWNVGTVDMHSHEHLDRRGVVDVDRWHPRLVEEFRLSAFGPARALDHSDAGC